MLCVPKPLKVADLGAQRKRRVRGNADKALQILNGFAVSFPLREFLNALIIPRDLLSRLVVADEIFPQRLVEQCVSEIQTVQPLQMLFRPVGALAVEMPVARAEGDRLLLDALELGFRVFPHTDVFLDRVVLLRRDMNGAISVIGKAPADAPGVHAVVLHTLSGCDGHGGLKTPL